MQIFKQAEIQELIKAKAPPGRDAALSLWNGYFEGCPEWSGNALSWITRETGTLALPRIVTHGDAHFFLEAYAGEHRYILDYLNWGASPSDGFSFFYDSERSGSCNLIEKRCGEFNDHLKSLDLDRTFYTLMRDGVLDSWRIANVTRLLANESDEVLRPKLLSSLKSIIDTNFDTWLRSFSKIMENIVELDKAHGLPISTIRHDLYRAVIKLDILQGTEVAQSDLNSNINELFSVPEIHDAALRILAACSAMGVLTIGQHFGVRINAEEAANSFREFPRHSGKALRVSVDIGVTHVPADLIFIGHQFIKNAARYANNAEIKVLEQNGSIILRIYDDGTGLRKRDGETFVPLRKEDFPLIFSGLSDRSGGGTGLQLVRALMKKRGGALAVGSFVQDPISGETKRTVASSPGASDLAGHLPAGLEHGAAFACSIPLHTVEAAKLPFAGARP